MTKLPPITPDDPLRAVRAPTDPAPAPTEPADAFQPSETPSAPLPAAQTSTGRTRPRETRRTAPSSVAPAAAAATELEGEWSGATDVTTVRVPTEILRLLRGRSHELRLPIGMIITAGLVDVLSANDQDLVERVDATQARYDQARRRANRAA